VYTKAIIGMFLSCVVMFVFEKKIKMLTSTKF